MVRKNPSEYTSVSILKVNRERLVRFGKYGDNMDSIIERILDMAESLQNHNATNPAVEVKPSTNISPKLCDYHNHKRLAIWH